MAASAALAWLVFAPTQVSAADMSEVGLSGDTYQCPAVAPTDPEELAKYEAYACADFNLETGAIGAPTADPVDGTLPPDGTGVVDPPTDGGGLPECPPDVVREDCIPPGDAPKGNNGVGNGLDGQPPGNPPINDGVGTSPGNPGNQGGSK